MPRLDGDSLNNLCNVDKLALGLDEEATPIILIDYTRDLEVSELLSTLVNYFNYTTRTMNNSLNATHLNLTETQPNLVDAFKQINSRPVILYQDGKQVAALISIEDLNLLERLIEEEEDRIDIADTQEMLAQIKVQGTTPWEDIKAKLEL